MNQNAYLTIDVGTGSVRVSLIGENIVPLDSKTLIRVAGLTMDADREWEQIVTLTRELLADNSGVRVLGVGVSTMVGWVMVDRDCNPTTELFSYMHQCHEECDKFCESFSRESFFSKVGRPPNPEFGGFKLLHLKNTDPERYRRTYKLLHFKDFLNARLCGEFSMDPVGGAYSAMIDLHTKNWHAPFVDALGVDFDKLPVIRECTELCGYTTKALEESTGLPAGTPVSMGGLDGVVGALGTGVVEEGTAADIMGSTEVLYVCSDTLRLDEHCELMTNPHVLPGKWLVGGPMGLSGASVAWYAENLLEEKYSLKELDAAAAKLSPGCDGVRFIPTFTGERVPHWNPDVRGTACGIGLQHTPAHLFRALMEGNCFNSRYMFDRLHEMGLDCRQVTAVGGGAKSKLWMQIKADITNVTLHTPKVFEATTLGVAMLIEYMLKGKVTVDPDSIANTFQPNPENVGPYDTVYHDYMLLFRTICKYYNHPDHHE